MEERHILYISIILFLTGVIYLSLYAYFSSPLTVTAITDSLEGERVRFTGIIEDKTVSDSGILYTLTGNTKAFIFQSKVNEMKAEGVNPAMFETGSGITVTGRVQRYRGSLEIVADDVSYD